MNSRKLLLFLVFTNFLFFRQGYSQSRLAPADPKAAREKFEKGNYDEAIKSYLLLLEKDPQNQEYNYYLGLSYLNTNAGKSTAIPYLEACVKKKEHDDNAWYYLGMAYHQTGKFDDALNAFEKFKNSGKGNSENKSMVGQQIQYCINAKELIRFPVSVKFENLGRNVNSPFADYLPFIPSDESFIVYNSKRKAPGAIKDVEGDGSYSAGIYVSKILKEDFTKAKNIGPPINNGAGDMEVVGMAPSGEIILLWRFEFELGYAAISQSAMDKSKNFKKAEPLDKGINTQDQEIFAAITNDGNTLYFSSIREGGYGGSDLYSSKKLPDGTWGKALNLGPEINTDLDEDYPNLSPDEKTLYFSSNGHVSMGGFDVFKAQWDDTSGAWINPGNMGYPINTPSNDHNFRVSASGRYGYVSTVRSDGLGDLDIYKVIFNDVEPKYTVIRGNVSSADTTKKLNYTDLVIKVNNSKTNEPYGSYLANPATGNFIVIIPPGSFSLSFEYEGFESIKENFTISDNSYTTKEIIKNFVLLPKAK